MFTSLKWSILTHTTLGPEARLQTCLSNDADTCFQKDHYVFAQYCRLIHPSGTAEEILIYLHRGKRLSIVVTAGQNSHETSSVYIQSPTFTMISTMVEVWRRQRRNDVFNVWSGGDGVYGGSGWTGTFRVCTDSPLFCARTSLQTSVFTTIGLIISFPVWLYIVLQSLQMLNKRAHTVYIYTPHAGWRRRRRKIQHNGFTWLLILGFIKLLF